MGGATVTAQSSEPRPALRRIRGSTLQEFSEA